MLGELAITPDVYRESSFVDAAAAAVAWERLRDPMLQECLLRDLYGGEMCRSLLDRDLGLSPKGKELLRKSARRRRKVPRCGEALPLSDSEWCAEAIASAETLPLDCIVTVPSTKAQYGSEELVSDAARLNAHPWWTNRGPSVRLDRKTDEYLRVLDRVLVASNSLMFIDPHLDPTKRHYSEFWRLLAHCHRSEAPVRVELHRGSTEGSGKKTEIPSLAEFQRRFTDELLPRLRGTNIKLKIVVWPEFHDRYLISDLIGISLPNGFDVSNRPDDTTTWNRLSRIDRDDIQREFEADRCPSGVNHGVIELIR